MNKNAFIIINSKPINVHVSRLYSISYAIAKLFIILRSN